jgi:hypothetical protein
MGSRARVRFLENNHEVIAGAMDSDPEIAFLSFIKGTLATGANVCDH